MEIVVLVLVAVVAVFIYYTMKIKNKKKELLKSIQNKSLYELNNQELTPEELELVEPVMKKDVPITIVKSKNNKLEVDSIFTTLITYGPTEDQVKIQVKCKNDLNQCDKPEIISPIPVKILDMTFPKLNYVLQFNLKDFPENQPVVVSNLFNVHIRK